MQDFVLSGRYVRLEPMTHAHTDALLAASSGDPALYRWSPVPKTRDEVEKYIATALQWKADGKAVPFAIVRLSDGTVVGSTRYFEMTRWAWPAGHPMHGRAEPDVCEIGYTWLNHSAIRTGINTEAKLLMLTHAFETWRVASVCLHTDMRNERSRAAMERMGAKFEGTLRSHRMAADFTARDSARYSITAAEWPWVKQRLHSLIAHNGH